MVLNKSHLPVWLYREPGHHQLQSGLPARVLLCPTAESLQAKLTVHSHREQNGITKCLLFPLLSVIKPISLSWMLFWKKDIRNLSSFIRYNHTCIKIYISIISYYTVHFLSKLFYHVRVVPLDPDYFLPIRRDSWAAVEICTRGLQHRNNLYYQKVGINTLLIQITLRHDKTNNAQWQYHKEGFQWISIKYSIDNDYLWNTAVNFFSQFWGIKIHHGWYRSSKQWTY